MARHWYQSKLFRIGAVVVAVLLLLLLLVPFLVPVDRFRPMVVDLLKEQTGRDVEIGGIRLHFLPRLHLQVSDFRIKNPQGFPEGDTLVVETIGVGVPLRPLLSRQVVIESVALNGVQMNLLEDQRGRTNYEFKKGRSASSAQEEPGEGERPLFTLTQIDAVQVNDVRVTSGVYDSRRRRVFPSYTVTGLNLDARRFAFTDPDWLKKLEAELDLGNVEIATPGLKQPLTFPSGELVLKEGKGAGKFSLALGPIAGQGDFKVPDLDNPRVDFNLSLRELDPARLSELLGEGGGNGPERSRASAPVGRRLLAAGTVKVGKVILTPFVAENVTGKVRFYSHKVDVQPFSVDFYGGRAEGALTVDRLQENLPASLTVKVQGVDVARVTSAAQGGKDSKISGTFEADGRLRTALANAPLAGLTGEGNFAVRDGVLEAFELKGTRDIMAAFLQIDLPSGDVPFRSFGGDFRIQDQRVRSRSVTLDSDALEAQLQGSFGLDGTLDYSGTGVLGRQATETQTQTEPQAQEQPQEQPRGLRGLISGLRDRVTGGTAGPTGRLRIPFAVRGTFAQPSFMLAGIPQRVGQATGEAKQ